MPIDYNALRAQRFAKKHRSIAKNLTEPLEKTVAEKNELIEVLTAENEKLVSENEKLVSENAELKKKIEVLTAENEKPKTAKSGTKAKG